jgi:hypothetical protein
MYATALPVPRRCGQALLCLDHGTSGEAEGQQLALEGNACTGDRTWGRRLANVNISWTALIPLQRERADLGLFWICLSLASAAGGGGKGGRPKKRKLVGFYAGGLH